MQTQAKTRGVNLTKILAYFAAQVAVGVTYYLSGKPRSLDEPPGATRRMDCSGEVRLLMHVGGIDFPDGSWIQREKCEELGWEQVPYSRACDANDGELFINFITAGVNGAGRVGHVWFTYWNAAKRQTMTLESYGGHGVGSRPATNDTLKRLHHKSFRVPVAAEAPKPNSEPAMLVWNRALLPMQMADGRVYVQLAAMLDQIGHKIVLTNDKTDLPLPRFYVNSQPKTAV